MTAPKTCNDVALNVCSAARARLFARVQSFWNPTGVKDASWIMQSLCLLQINVSYDGLVMTQLSFCLRLINEPYATRNCHFVCECTYE